jgi:hypothetical protein
VNRRSQVLLGALIAFCGACFIAQGAANPKPLPKIKVSENRHFLVDETGKPFFYLADTAWSLFHRLNREEAVRYLDVRARQRFTVVQVAAIGESNGLRVPNAYGDLPFIDFDPARPATTAGASPAKPQEYDYWDHVDYIVDEANRRGIYVAMLPTWGSWVEDVRNDRDDRVITARNAQGYGEFLGKRYGKKGIIWVLGGDRNPSGYEEVWRALARGIAIGVTGREDYNAVLMTYHPRGAETSSTLLHNEAWLSFNMQQNGHNAPTAWQIWNRIATDYARTPVKPVLDGEPIYEDHPVNFNSRQNGYSFDAHVRQAIYDDLFAGACGHTYGNHAVWQMYAPPRAPINGPLMYWYEAILRPGAGQMQYARALMESRPYLSRVPDQSLLAEDLPGVDHISATRGDGYLFVYSPIGKRFTVRMGKISGAKVNATWYNPRDGAARPAGSFDNAGAQEFTPPSEGFGSDWVLVLDDAARGFPPPGAVPAR